jgi:hypothetical protein
MIQQLSAFVCQICQQNVSDTCFVTRLGHACTFKDLGSEEINTEQLGTGFFFNTIGSIPGIQTHLCL